MAQKFHFAILRIEITRASLGLSAINFGLWSVASKNILRGGGPLVPLVATALTMLLLVRAIAISDLRVISYGWLKTASFRTVLVVTVER